MGASGIRETFVVVDARENAPKSRNSDENAGANQFATRRRIQFTCASTSEVWRTIASNLHALQNFDVGEWLSHGLDH